MSTQQQKQLLYPGHKHLSQFTLVLLVVVGSLLMGLMPLIYGFALTDTSGSNFVIPAEAELWSSLGKVNQ